MLVRTAGLEPALPFGKQIFVPLRLSPPLNVVSVRGLDYPFALACQEALGAARLVSTPSLEGFPPRAWLGISLGSPR